MKKFKYLFKEMDNPDTPSRAAMSLKEKPNKEPMGKLKEQLNVKTPSVEAIAKKHGVDVSVIENQLKMGMKVEKEHTTNEKDAREIALDHLNEKPNYYTKLAKYVEQIEEQNDTTEKVEMTQSQLHFIAYACEEILDFIKMGGEVEEWYQVKVAKSFSEFESLHSFIEGEKRRTGMVKEDAEQLDELSTEKMLAYRSKAVEKLGSGTPQQDIKRKAGIGVSGFKIKQKLKQSMKKEEVEQIDEISMEKLTQYKTAAAKSASEADKAGDIAKGNKRFSGIVKATKKQFAKTTMKEGENPQIKGGDPCWKGYEMVGKKKKGGKMVPNCVPTNEAWNQPDYSQSIKARQAKADKEAQEKKDDLPFTPDAPKKKDVVPGKQGGEYSRVRHIARQALQKQKEKMSPMKTVKESKKAEIVKDAVKKKKEVFNPDPELSSNITKT